MKLFSLQKLIAHKLSAKSIFSQHNFLFEIAADDLIERLQSIQQKFPVIAELNFLPTPLTNYIRLLNPDSYIHINIHPDLSDNIDIITDLETLDLEPGSVDLFVACLNLHWINDLPSFLAQIKYSLKPGGIFLGSCFGEKTLHQLRYAIYATQEELKTGFSQHISPFLKTKDAAALLQHVGFRMVVSDCNETLVEYPTLATLFNDLRGMGETNNMVIDHNPFSPSFIHKLETIYVQQQQNIITNFDIVTFTGSI